MFAVGDQVEVDDMRSEWYLLEGRVEEVTADGKAVTISSPGFAHTLCFKAGALKHIWHDVVPLLVCIDPEVVEGKDRQIVELQRLLDRMWEDMTTIQPNLEWWDRKLCEIIPGRKRKMTD